MKVLLKAALLLLLLSACERHSSLYRVAVENLPSCLDEAMREQMNTVDSPKILDVSAIYDCDSLCVLQCHAEAPDENGTVLKETVRFFFVKDMFVSFSTGVPSYSYLVKGGKILDKKEIRAFSEEMQKGGTERYLYYLGTSIPL